MRIFIHRDRVVVLRNDELRRRPPRRILHLQRLGDLRRRRTRNGRHEQGKLLVRSRRTSRPLGRPRSLESRSLEFRARQRGRYMFRRLGPSRRAAGAALAQSRGMTRARPRRRSPWRRLDRLRRRRRLRSVCRLYIIHVVVIFIHVLLPILGTNGIGASSRWSGGGHIWSDRGLWSSPRPHGSTRHAPSMLWLGSRRG